MTVYLSYDDTNPDEHGRRRFITRWWSGGYFGGWRGQYFHAVPDTHISRWRDRGYTVRLDNPYVGA